MSDAYIDALDKMIKETKKQWREKYFGAKKEERQMSENVKAAMPTYGATLDELIELRKKTEAQYDALPVYDKEPVMSTNGEFFYLDCPACKARARHDFRYFNRLSFRYFNRFSGSQPMEVGIEKPSIRTECQNCGYVQNFKVELEEAVVPVAPHVRRKRRTKEEIEAEKANPITASSEVVNPMVEPEFVITEPKE